MFKIGHPILGENLYGLSPVAHSDTWRYARLSMLPEFPYNERNPQDCPTCGKRLVNATPRLERDGNGNLEIVHVYLCFAHGFYTFRLSEGLKKGL